MRAYQYPVKTQFVRYYRASSYQVADKTTGKPTRVWMRVYAPSVPTYTGIYSTIDPGFRATVRSLTSKERAAGGEVFAQGGIVAVTGRCPGLRAGDWIEFQGRDYQIQTVDELDFTSREIKVTAVERASQKATRAVVRALDRRWDGDSD